LAIENHGNDLELMLCIVCPNLLDLIEKCRGFLVCDHFRCSETDMMRDHDKEWGSVDLKDVPGQGDIAILHEDFMGIGMSLDGTCVVGLPYHQCVPWTWFAGQCQCHA